MFENILELTTEWLRNQIGKTQYGSVGVTFTIHDGEIRRITKTVEEKEQL